MGKVFPSFALALPLALLLSHCANLACPSGQELGGSSCVPACGPDGCPCTLEGIETAIAQGGMQVLQCSDGARVNTTETVVIDNDVILDGQDVTLQGDGRHLMFEVQSSEVELIGFTIQGGDQAIRVSTGATLTLTNSTVKDNTSRFSAGGGIRNDAVLTLVGTTVEGNTSAVGSGGGIYNTGTLTLTDSKVLRNQSDIGPGGGIQNDQGMVVVNDGSEISVNTAAASDGGGISNANGTVTVMDSTIEANTASENGGGISNANGTVDVIDTMIKDNMALAHGGGLSSTGESAIISLTSTTVVGNKVIENSKNRHGGGIYLSFGKLDATRTTWSGNESALDAGAILVEGATAVLTLQSSTISGNRAEGIGGGIRVYMGTARIINSTIFDNRAADGGALHLGFPSADATVELRNSTVSNNDDVGRFGIPISQRTSAAISHIGGTVSFIQSLIDDTCCCGPASSTTISQDHNIESPEDTCQLDGANDTVSVTPQALNLAGQLADNGGDTMTLMLTRPSVAVDYMISTCDQPEDQRGIPRPQGLDCDIGAVELQ